MRHCRLITAALVLSLPLVSTSMRAQQPPPAGGGQAGSQQGAQQGPAQPRAPRPYDQVITSAAKTERGVFAVHHVGDRYFFEIDDAMLGRDFLLVSRISGVPAGSGGFTSAGSSIAERMVRWERRDNNVLLRSISVDSYADPETPISKSVIENNFAPILASFPIAAFGAGNATAVVDVTDFFAGDTPALAGLSTAQRRTYAVQRFDAARSFVSQIRSFPTNIEVRHVQTYAATEGPGDRGGGTVSLEMRQSIVLLPKEPMRPRSFDPRVGYFNVDRVNYGLDQLKATTETFIARWRLEPKDPAAYARGELVEPVKPIVYYIDPATPMRWRRHVKAGVEEWQKVFEKAGFKRAIIATDPPTKAEDPDWDPDDARVSMVRWAASLVRNAVGPHTSDPRTGEILNSEITWYHNHMRSYRNRLLLETAAANPAARTLEVPEELMGETMRQVIAHEIGHALGLQHNMVASNSFPVESLRDPKFTSKYGVSATIMDYARQNYVAQPGDGLQPKDFIRRVGPFDDFAINWGYRVLPQATTAEAEKATLNDWISKQSGAFPYRFVPGQYGSIDPRSQTEDMGDDPIKASTYAVANFKRMVPNLIKWTTKPGDDYSELNELYTEGLGQWSTYMGHVAQLIAGVNVDLKTADQAGGVYTVVPKTPQLAALAFLNEHVFATPDWLQPPAIAALIGPSALPTRQVAVLNNLLSNIRLGRLAEIEKFDAKNAWPLADYLAEMKRLIWNTPAATTPDANRRGLQRAYVARLGAIVNPPAPPPPAAGAAAPAAPPVPAAPFVAAPNLSQSDVPALARAQLRAIQAQARASATAAANPVVKAHWSDIVDRVGEILEPRR
ncbi:MAG TPA: zinc-dependent metalloprotease [Vicinamibacterales bacterium]|nr:zinc-dependent metalloprotease [Vicinamibacterales bacterium]